MTVNLWINNPGAVSYLICTMARPCNFLFIFNAAAFFMLLVGSRSVLNYSGRGRRNQGLITRHLVSFESICDSHSGYFSVQNSSLCLASYEYPAGRPLPFVWDSTWCLIIRDSLPHLRNFSPTSWGNDRTYTKMWRLIFLSFMNYRYTVGRQGSANLLSCLVQAVSTSWVKKRVPYWLF